MRGAGGPTHGKDKERLDQLLVQRGLAESRAKAQALILAGQVYSGERRLEKPGQALATSTPIEMRGKAHPYVSRGGLKLAHGLAAFGISPEGRVALDIGASTGGFTDVLLRAGVTKVYAVDVGHGQLAWSLRQDPRVVVRERCNARYLDRQTIPEPVGMIVCDASFIGLRLVLAPALELAAPGAFLVALIKPQFEVGPAEVGGRGVVRDPALHSRVCEAIAAWLDARADWRVLGVHESPITGPEGNKEFLIGAQQAG